MSNKAMKKTHWLRNTLITLVACGIAGLILAVILFNANPERTCAESSIEFRFDGAAEGLAPNRNTLQVYTRYLYRSQKGVLKLNCSIILSTLKDLDGGIEYVQRHLEQEHLEEGGGTAGAH